MSPTLFSFGHGYVAQALGRRLQARDWRVFGTARLPAKRDGAEMLLWPGGDIAAALASATHVLTSVPPDAEGDPVLREWRGEMGGRWLGYLSSTSVYGDCAGEWVDEATPLRPGTGRGRARAAAEREWLALGAQVFRLGGIYGPGRSALDRVRDGSARRIVKPGQVFSRIHVDDIVEVLMAAMQWPRPGAVYNVVDVEPAPPQDVIAHAAGLLGVAPPPEEPFDTADLTQAARRFYAENKRVRGELIRTELGVTLRHPTYREGLAAILAEEGRAQNL